jgi:DNA-binding HxlR family transcriptional regulator
MRRLVESLKRLYGAERMKDERLQELVKSGEITRSEYEYIVS